MSTALVKPLCPSCSLLSASHVLFVSLISHQPAVLFSPSKPAISNQPTTLFSQNKPAPAISYQPNEQNVNFLEPTTHAKLEISWKESKTSEAMYYYVSLCDDKRDCVD
jgi:hypothetical protein